MTENDHESRIKFLESQMRQYASLLEQLDKAVPCKYRKAFYKQGEDPYFRHKPFLPQLPKTKGLDGFYGEGGFGYIQMPDDPKEYKKAKERMAQLLEESTYIPQVYYKLYDREKFVKEELDPDKVDQWISEGEFDDPPFKDEISNAYLFKIPARFSVRRWRKVKPQTSEASPSVPSTQAESPPSNPSPDQP